MILAFKDARAVLVAQVGRCPTTAFGTPGPWCRGGVGLDRASWVKLALCVEVRLMRLVWRAEDSKMYGSSICFNLRLPTISNQPGLPNWAHSK